MDAMPTDDEKRAAASILRRIEHQAVDMEPEHLARLTEAYFMLMRGAGPTTTFYQMGTSRTVEIPS